MAVCFAADFKHNNRKDKCRFFGFRVIQKKSWIQEVGSLYLSNFNSLKKWLICVVAIAIVNKYLVNRTVSFENELVPLNGRIRYCTWLNLSYNSTAGVNLYRFFTSAVARQANPCSLLVGVEAGRVSLCRVAGDVCDPIWQPQVTSRCSKRYKPTYL